MRPCTRSEIRPRLRRWRATQCGVTLIELVVALTVLAILVAMGVPSFSDAGLPSQLRAVANRLSAATQLARNEAIKRDATVTLCPSLDANTCDAAATNWNEGWIVTSAGLLHPLLYEPAAPNGYRVTAAGGSIALSFQPSGVGATPETFTICRATPTVGTQQKSVAISAVGHAVVQTRSGTTCP